MIVVAPLGASRRGKKKPTPASPTGTSRPSASAPTGSRTATRSSSTTSGFPTPRPSPRSGRGPETGRSSSSTTKPTVPRPAPRLSGAPPPTSLALPTRRWCSPAPPMPNRKADLVAIFDLVWPGHGHRLVAGGLAHLRNRAFVRATKRDLGLPPMDVRAERVALDPLHRRVYDAMADAVGDWVTDPEATAAEAGKALIVAVNRTEGRKTLVWSNFVDNVRVIGEALSHHDPATIVGATSVDDPFAPSDRIREIDRFRNDPTAGYWSQPPRPSAKACLSTAHAPTRSTSTVATPPEPGSSRSTGPTASGSSPTRRSRAPSSRPQTRSTPGSPRSSMPRSQQGRCTRRPCPPPGR